MNTLSLISIGIGLGAMLLVLLLCAMVAVGEKWNGPNEDERLVDRFFIICVAMILVGLFLLPL